MCCVYPAVFVIAMTMHDPLELWNWLPTRFSPVLSLQLVSAGWASYAILCMMRCYFSRHKIPDAG